MAGGRVIGRGSTKRQAVPLRSKLKQDLAAAGLLELRPGATYLKAAVLLALTAAFLTGAVLAPPWWVKAPFFAAGLVVSIALIMVGHESGHGAISRRRWANDLIGYFTFPFFAGVSFGFWKHKHGTHHAHVNVAGKDPDIVIYPMAMNRSERATCFGIASMVQSVQGFAFWPLTLLTGFAFRVDSLRYMLGIGRRSGTAGERLLDVTCLLGHAFLWLVVPVVFLHVSLLAVVLFYVAWSLGAGLLLAAIFIPAHTTLPIYSGYHDNERLQLETTQNLVTNRLFSWLLIGLDHQVEHHLFPRMSHLCMRRAAPLVREHCQQSGLPYQEQPWGQALRDSTFKVHELRDYEPMPQPTVTVREADDAGVSARMGGPRSRRA